MDVSHLLDELNPSQREAVTAPAGHHLVLAGAGSGKTRVLTHRIGWLLQVERVSPWSVLAVTFTNKAAGEMRGRTESLIAGGARGLSIGTFHGIAHRLLRRHWREAKLPETFQILDADDQQRLVKRTIQGMELDEARFPPRQADLVHQRAKDEGKRADALDPGFNPANQVLIDIYRAYEAACQRAGLVDFAELLLRAHELWLHDPALLAHYRERFRHLLIDEFQDTNTLQYAWIRVLAGDSGHVFVVGDDDQAIYGWRGAKVENVQHFLRDFPGAKTIRLEQNYRSTGTILAAANAVIAHNPDRLGKQLWTAGDSGEPIELYAAYNEQDEARYVIERIRAHVREGGQAVRCRDPVPIECAIAQLRRAADPARAAVPRSMAACASSTAPRSRTRWPTCAWSRTATTTPPSSARSTRRRAASANARSTCCASARAATTPRCGRRCSASSPPTRWPGGRKTRLRTFLELIEDLARDCLAPGAGAPPRSAAADRDAETRTWTRTSHWRCRRRSSRRWRARRCVTITRRTAAAVPNRASRTSTNWSTWPAASSARPMTSRRACPSSPRFFRTPRSRPAKGRARRGRTACS